MRVSKFKSSLVYNSIVCYNNFSADIQKYRSLKNVLKIPLVPNNYIASKK